MIESLACCKEDISISLDDVVKIMDNIRLCFEIQGYVEVCKMALDGLMHFFDRQIPGPKDPAEAARYNLGLMLAGQGMARVRL